MPRIRSQLVEVDLPYIGDADSKIRFIEQHGTTIRVLHEHYIREEFAKLVGGIPSPIDLGSKLDILRVANADIIAMSKEEKVTMDELLAYSCPKPVITDANRHNLKMWSHLLNYNYGFVIRLNPNAIKDV